MPADLTEHTLDSTTVYQGRLLHAKLDRVRLPDGSESTREYLVHPGAAVILPIFDNGDILLERQHRYPLRRDFLELPAGKFDPGETELACAQRELLEETGYVAETWRYINTQYPCIGYSDERLVFFLARTLRHEGDKLDHDEFLEILRVPFVAALEMVRDGRINEGKTVMGLLWWANFGDR
ncbi:NUDIX hydrolase [Parasulfuritortus cantonensis]|uniref:GDP-mannose pyrophosphatase n=1 Tax=Parasulfuritortus cantonensis TaxID=2528202 RepID=A0A4R1BSQ5_9PROT|nr:NUDIX hydrolase [Parasulfuritortus cantonensis]TCJ20417.1 NUDIX hydrolase [Parasulfuritortus cantonensis]